VIDVRVRSEVGRELVILGNLHSPQRLRERALTSIIENLTRPQ